MNPISFGFGSPSLLGAPNKAREDRIAVLYAKLQGLRREQSALNERFADVERQLEEMGGKVRKRS